MNHGVTFNVGSAKVSSPAIFEAYFSYDKIYGLLQLIIIIMHFYIIVLFPLTAILQLINFTVS